MKITKEFIGAGPFVERAVHYEFIISNQKKLVVKYNRLEENLEIGLFIDGELVESSEYTDWWDVIDALIIHTKENGSKITSMDGTILLQRDEEIAKNVSEPDV
jgi:hypothetical protein